MVDVRSRRCAHDSCFKRPRFNIKGIKKPAYCKNHAEDSMVNVYGRRCSYFSCTKPPRYNVKGSMMATHCKQHAANNMVSVSAKCCSHTSCLKRPAWGVLTDSEATTCLRHTGDILGGPVINFKPKCTVTGCRSISCWGFHGEQPTHCHDHGPLEGGLVCTLRTAGSKRRCRMPPSSAVRGPTVRVKTECFF